MNDQTYAELMRENRNIKQKIKNVEDRIERRQQRAIAKNEEQLRKETFQYRFFQMFPFLKAATPKDYKHAKFTAEERYEHEIKEKAEKLNKILSTNDES